MMGEMKRRLVILGSIVLLIGIGLILVALFGNFFASADTPAPIGTTEADALRSLLIFGGSMVGGAIVMFSLLARVG